MTITNSQAISPSSSTFLLIREEERGLLKLNEFLSLKTNLGASEYNLKQSKRILNSRNFKEIAENSSSKEILIQKLLNYGDSHLRDQNIVCDYIFLNMVFGGLPLDRDFIEYWVYKKRNRRQMLFRLYEIYKPTFFPSGKLEMHYRLKLFLASLWLFYDMRDINDKVILSELTSNIHPRGMSSYWVLKKPMVEVIREFIILIAPAFLEKGLLLNRDNLMGFICNHLDERKNNRSDEELLWEKFEKEMKFFSGTKFHSVLNKFIKEKVSKKNLNLSTLNKYITYWAKLTYIAINEGFKDIYLVNTTVRDMYIWEYGDEISLKEDMNCFRSIFKFYNEITFNDEYEKYFDISIFSSKQLAKKPVDTKHVYFMEEAEDALIASIANEIFSTRKPFEELDLRQRQIFFMSRIIWLKFLTGARISELLVLELDMVKNSIKHDYPYIYIVTSKDNVDRKFEFERGKTKPNGKHEYDCVHIDIINETVIAAQEVYKGIKINQSETRFLFSTEVLTPFSYDSIKYYFRTVQQRNAIICGSHYDIMNRDLYESMSDMKVKLQNERVLFNLHDIRHIYINKLILHGMTNTYSIRDEVGHVSVLSQETYKKIPNGMMQVAKLMETQGHYGAENQLMSSLSFQVEKSTNRKDIVLAPKLDAYLNELDNIASDIYNGITIPYDQAKYFIDTNTTCETKLSCGETGFGCLGCKDFVSGQATHEALLNVGAILIHQFKTIDYEISRLNDKRLRQRKHVLKFQRLLMSLLDRFEGVHLAKEHTLINSNNFAWDEERAEKYLTSIAKKVRKTNFDKEVTKYIKKLMEEKQLSGKITSRLHLLTSKTNRKVLQ
ncbi:site-specific integrase [Priestia endophytica]|uniref:site-specific integrase n=1 Tax=Priestia endophytica TaxID=135735 RepID=UPI000DCA53C3|nr:site-specific integrase [Priestia endophytica]RAS83083.1 hypothetical protein A4R27_08030 [Priestia endophytica]